MTSKVTLSLYFILIFFIIFISGCSSADKDIRPTNESSTPTLEAEENSAYSELIDNITAGGPPKDGIPPIDNPKYISTTKADEFLEAHDKVFIYETSDEVYIYPQRILVWHEIVNDTFNDENISITYCPLTGSTIAYTGTVGTVENTDYGTSGKLLNSNLVMYDRATESYIPQILGTGITGTLQGVSLETNPIYWGDWSHVKDIFPNSKVLSKETGFIRDYDKDPYGSYKPEDTDSYYYADGILFPLMNRTENKYKDKKMVIGVKINSQVIALLPEIVKEKKILHFKLNDTPLVAFYDDSIRNIRIFKSIISSKPLKFKQTNGIFVDQHGTKWNSKGISENKDALESVTHFEVMWFAWYAFYPETQVIE